MPFCFTDGGNIPYDMGGYYIHALVNMLGPVKRVGGFSRAFEPKEIYRNPRHPDYKGGIDLDVSTIMTGSLEFWNGCYANLTTMGVSHLNEIPRLEIYGTEGTLILPDPNTFCGPVILMRGTSDENLQTCEMPLTHGYGYKTQRILRLRKRPTNGRTATAESASPILHGQFAMGARTAAARNWDCTQWRLSMELSAAARKTSFMK